MKGTVAIALGMITGGILLVGLGYMLVGADMTGFNSKNSHYIEKTYECTEDVDSIRIDELSGAVVLQAGDVDKVSVAYSDKEKTIYEITEEKGELAITRLKESGSGFFQIDFSEHVMTITVPDSFKGKVDITDKSGRISLNRIDGKEISVQNTSGSIRMDDVSCKKDLTAGNTSGSVQMKNVEAGGDVHIENTSGSIKLEQLQAKGNVAVKGSSGGIRLDELDAGGNIILKNTSGSIKGTIVGKESDYRIDSHVSSGSNNLTNSDQGEKELNVSTTSGSIRILFTE